MSFYIKEKTKILKQLGIRLNKHQLEHLHKLQTEISVDNYARSLILSTL